MGQLNAAEVLRLRPTSAVSLDQSVRGSAQDDDLMGGLHTTGSTCRKHEKIEKVTASERSALQIYRKQRALWRGVEEPVPSAAEGTPAMLVCRCSWERSGRKLQRKIKKSQTPDRSGVEGPAIFFPYFDSFVSDVFSAALH